MCINPEIIHGKQGGKDWTPKVAHTWKRRDHQPLSTFSGELYILCRIFSSVIEIIKCDCNNETDNFTLHDNGI